MPEESRKIIPLRAPPSAPAPTPAPTPLPTPLPPFVDLLRANLDALYRLAVHIVGSPEDAQDVVQEAALNGFRGYASVRDGGAAKAWLFRVLERSVTEARAGLEASEQSHRIQLARFEAGTGLGVEVIQAQNGVARARIELVDTVLRFNAEQVELLGMIGHLTPE